MTLADFLLARIAEDKEGFGGFGVIAIRVGKDGEPSEQRIVPPRVVAECEAKRQIVELHCEGRADVFEDSRLIGRDIPTGDCRTCAQRTPWPCRTLRALALAYSDHPDFSDDWRP
jgi:hypothetical protein